MKRIIIFAAAFFYLSTYAADLEYFKYYKDAAATKTDAQAVSCIFLDSEVYSKTSDLNSGLRIIDKDEREIPFALRLVYLKNTKKSQFSFASKIESLQKIDNKVVLTVSQKVLVTVSSISLSTSAKNFEKSISVAGSNDKYKWTEIVNDQIIFDYSSIIPLRKVQIQLPPSKYKFFRITINNFTEEKTSPIRQLVTEEQSGITLKQVTSTIKRKTHIKIDSVYLTQEQLSKTNSALKKCFYPLKNSEVTTKDKKTIINLSSNSEPLSEVILSTPSTNFSRDIILAGSNDRKGWIVIAKQKWTKSNIFKTQSDAKKSICFGEKRFKFYRLTIENGDNPPLENVSVSARGNIYRLIMLGRQDLNLKLYYGGNVKPPQYEITNILPGILDISEIEYKLSEEKVNPEFTCPIEPANYKWLFTVVIGAVAVILIIILFKNIGKLNNIEAE